MFVGFIMPAVAAVDLYFELRHNKKHLILWTGSVLETVDNLNLIQVFKSR